ncbi:fibronectin type III domain-containing protein [Candidatus Microgenomates bacterium]|nr:fibronectin type III domain-containing protein [Candidatus Microgenomates bacterium]
MKKSFWNRRFPTLLGLLVLAASTFGISFLVKEQQIFELRAVPSLVFEDIAISNQTANSLTVSFQTKELTGAQIKFGASLDEAPTFFDDRDAIGSQVGQYRNHYFTLTNLSPGREYLFALIMKGKMFDNEGKGFIAKTSSAALSPDKEVEPMRGEIISATGQEVKDALVYAKITGAVLSSTIVKSQGKFLLPLSGLSTADLTSIYSFAGNEEITIEVIGDDGTEISVVTTFDKHADIGQIILGQNLKESSGFNPEAISTDSTGQTPAIIVPQDGAFVSDQRPLIRGSGKPAQRIEITVESQPQTKQLTVGDNGQWVYRPDQPLSPGKHTVSVSFFDGDRIVNAIQSQFEVLASGSQVQEVATPSPTIVVSLAPTPIPTQIEPSPTVAPIPTTATTFPIVLFMSLGIISIAGGIFLVLLPKIWLTKG